MFRRLRSKKAFMVLVIIVVVVLIGLGAYNLIKNYSSGARPSGWQAVFLNNGQVYFGHLSGLGGSTVTLNDVYYLPIERMAELQPKRNINDVGQPPIALIKLGTELHAPTSQMKINRNSVVITEDLRSDSKIVDAIKKMQ